MIRAIWQSTLDEINQAVNSQATLADKKNALLNPAKEYDCTVPMNLQIEERISSACENMTYPDCNDCHQPLCGPNTKATCNCVQNQSFQKSYIELTSHIEKTEQSLLELANAPFRQSRNAVGFAGSVFSGLNLLLSNIATHLSVIWTIAVIACPPLLLGLYVYKRGKKEENEINTEHYANFIEEKLKTLRDHSNKVMANHAKIIVNTPQKSIKQKPEKEKRGIMGNSFSHFVVPAILTAGMIYSVLKFGLLASIIAVGGPVTWGIALGAAIAVGCYFAYKRYQHLTKKVQFEENFHKLSTLKNKPLDIQPDVKQENTNTYSLVYQQTKNSSNNLPPNAPEFSSANTAIKIPTIKYTRSASFSHSPANAPFFTKKTVTCSQSFSSPSTADMLQLKNR